MANIRQTILLREDLDLPKGLSEAQVAHLHMEFLRKNFIDAIDGKVVSPNKTVEARLNLGEDFIAWLKSPYIFVHGIPNVEVLEHFRKVAFEKGIEVTEWKDTVYIKVSEKQTIVVENCLVGLALGPCDSDRIKAVIGDLPLLREKE